MDEYKSDEGGGASYLDRHPTLIFNICIYGTPIADMLVNSPLLSLVIDHYGRDVRDITAEGEGGIMLTLEYHDRVSRPPWHVCSLYLGINAIRV